MYTNLISGVGKTFVAAGIGIDAVKKGYKVSFVRMDNLVQLLKTQKITRSSRTKLKQITTSNLVIIDDLMFMAMEKFEANLFFRKSSEILKLYFMNINSFDSLEIIWLETN